MQQWLRRRSSISRCRSCCSASRSKTSCRLFRTSCRSRWIEKSFSSTSRPRSTRLKMSSFCSRKSWTTRRVTSSGQSFCYCKLCLKLSRNWAICYRLSRTAMTSTTRKALSMMAQPRAFSTKAWLATCYFTSNIGGSPKAALSTWMRSKTPIYAPI